MSVAILGSGAFGTALAVALGREGRVTLWGRSAAGARLPGVVLPDSVTVTADLAAVEAQTVLIAVPTQALGGFLAEHAARLDGRRLVACCKGVDLATGLGPTGLIARACPAALPALLTGPSFAADIARGLPTALTLACADEAAGEALQRRLSTGVLRLYRTTDVTGAEMGGALKNVVAIAAGVVIGAGLGDSARAALMTRGYAEMVRLALRFGARAETLAGLSGFGDLVLTCTSDQSRNFRYGRALGAGQPFDTSVTVEGVATAKAVCDLAQKHAIDMPVAMMVSALTRGRIALPDAIQALMSRPLKQE
ncbi:NAD(P)H-dependent glycerol-3-phosphate dehydrogenase [Paracoccaceae bacterium Fryx2]|nr:NAD(P)H-dependent glycerol-3-phosphate dehydrogenase [Paracoccaceae bacterium Fryx2]